MKLEEDGFEIIFPNGLHNVLVMWRNNKGSVLC